MIRYDTIEEFNVDSKAECDQINLAHETKIKNASAQLVQYRLKIPEGCGSGEKTTQGHVFVCFSFDNYEERLASSTRIVASV